MSLTLLGAGLIGLTAGSAAAVVIAPPPGQAVVALEEHILLVFDPLTATQTVILHHTFEGTSTSFGVLIPTPAPARAVILNDRLRRALADRLHPSGRIQRALDVRLVSWAAGCAIRDVGDRPPADSEERRGPGLRATSTSLGGGAEPLHDWLLGNGFTLSPAQAQWISELRGLGWSFVGVAVHPPDTGPVPPARLRGPVIALSHPAEEPMLAAGHPPFGLTMDAPTLSPEAEVSVLTEWAVAVDRQEPIEPFFADLLSRREVARLGMESGAIPWAFRRDGTLTAFRLPPLGAPEVLRFARTDPRPRLRPPARPRLRLHRIQLPIELLLLGVLLIGWLWSRYATVRRRGSADRLK